MNFLPISLIRSIRLLSLIRNLCNLLLLWYHWILDLEFGLLSAILMRWRTLCFEICGSCRIYAQIVDPKHRESRLKPILMLLPLHLLAPFCGYCHVLIQLKVSSKMLPLKSSEWRRKVESDLFQFGKPRSIFQERCKLLHSSKMFYDSKPLLLSNKVQKQWGGLLQ